VNRGGRAFVTNGVILSVVAVVLAVYFSINSLWNAGTIVVIALIAVLSCFYFWLYCKFFNKNS